MIGKIFYDLQKRKYYIINIFNDNDVDIITYKYWVKNERKWIYQSDELGLFLIGFNYGWHWA